MRRKTVRPATVCKNVSPAPIKPPGVCKWLSSPTTPFLPGHLGGGGRQGVGRSGGPAQRRVPLFLPICCVRNRSDLKNDRRGTFSESASAFISTSYGFRPRRVFVTKSVPLGGSTFDPQRTGPRPRRLTPTAESKRSRRFAFSRILRRPQQRPVSALGESASRRRDAPRRRVQAAILSPTPLRAVAGRTRRVDANDCVAKAAAGNPPSLARLPGAGESATTAGCNGVCDHWRAVEKPILAQIGTKNGPFVGRRLGKCFR